MTDSSKSMPTTQAFTIIETILRDRTAFFTEIRNNVGVGHKVKSMLISCLAFLAIYGFVMGVSHSSLQAVSSVVKLPALFLLTLFICAPSLHFFNILFGSQQTIGQTVALILTAISTTSVLLFSLAPITLFFLLTSSQYAFFKLLNVACFTIAGLMGAIFLQRGMRIVTERAGEDGIIARRLFFLLWVLLYGFVGSQMAWTLSPFIGDPDKDFILFRRIGGNVYVDIIESIAELVTK